MPNTTGFDSLAYPGQLMMAWLKANTNLSFCGYYLAPAPSRPNSAWMGERATLAAQGWGFAPVYVGQQAPGTPNCSYLLSTAQGVTDGQDALDLMGMANEGFPVGSTLYLDLEGGDPASQAMKDYFAAWVDTVEGSGTYHAGLYCSHTKAASLQAVRNVPIWAVKIVAPPPVMHPPFAQYDPVVSGVTNAVVCQYVIDTVAAFPGAPTAQMKVDLDCAVVTDPSDLSGIVLAPV